jgi:hypothetical protein
VAVTANVNADPMGPVALAALVMTGPSSTFRVKVDEAVPSWLVAVMVMG